MPPSLGRYSVRRSIGGTTKHLTAIAIALLSTAALAHAADITDDTPARAITIGKPEGDLDRVVVSPGFVTMNQCREALETNAAALKEGSDAIFCVPTDLTDSDMQRMPLVDLTK